ncbi:DNA-binding response regulator [Parabacteroides sp. AM58-2XD]|uniref:LytR/AlgR family response regulator transcription factor n=1 Tax=Parabacteroides TaxID=375288 RepID=UPI000FE1D04A|nr:MULTISPECIES: LytTR family DNA-binding domain-containing protein [Parabacteroides]RGY92718.1 DNA-binding response regulator [Parabacteroides sp. AM58-2XD]GKG72895.1 DNA-binding response regulator [Parabacteroides goldsteinii]GKG78830.1 DNA-binding response regulator [Parabacteroides goldsteinii]
MKVLIIEDEQPAAHKLIRLLEEADKQIEVIDVLASIEQTINWLAVHPGPELIFMDIQLEDGISFEIFETCKIQTPVIFITAYDEYALKAFKVNSIDYLLKPIAPDDLKAALDKFNVLHRQQANYSRLESIISQLQPKTKERFLIKIGEHYRSVQTLSIHCFFIMERNTFIQTDTGKTYPIDYSLDKIEQLVDPGQFFRINRNFIVNFSAIQDILIYSSGRLKIILNGWTEKEDILVSRERVTEFKEWMDR